MRETLTISIPKELRRDLDRISKAEGLSRSDLVRESLRDFLFFHRFKALRDRMRSKARRRGIHTDEDVFKRVL